MGFYFSIEELEHPQADRSAIKLNSACTRYVPLSKLTSLNLLFSKMEESSPGFMKRIQIYKSNIQNAYHNVCLLVGQLNT